MKETKSDRGLNDDLDYCPDCDKVLRFKDCFECGWKSKEVK